MKTVLVMTMTVLAFTASHSLPRAYNPASHEGQKVKGEEGEKQRDDPICSTDGAGHLTCNNLGFCAANRDKPSDEFYRCTPNTDGSFKKELCTCSEGCIFSDVDPNEPCVNNSSLVDRQERLFFSDESENNNCGNKCGNEETTTTESSNCTTTESSTITATETNTDPEQNSTTPTKEPPTPTPPFKCEKLGSFPDPQDCHKYYQCEINSSGIMTAEHRTCGPGQYFDPQDSICEIGSCINPTTTTKPPKFECESLGEFQDPVDCHHYYICKSDTNGFIKQHCECDDGMYFDPEFSSCAYGTCP
ncbi:uncharacterized protein LOC124159540 [Ischnura elegans]|uniref:uncharacterized protein LOC124159540 n=1 Tax=Ischnura elegans TaxID=197161 RepID=UPI001ED8A895|nr:uncharacterized protein LOC124159540 [Ischnura elegans]